jgi:hypothetical protein
MPPAPLSGIELAADVVDAVADVQPIVDVGLASSMTGSSISDNAP